MEILLAVGVMAACFALLGAGLLLRRKKNCLQGSCGGAAAKDPDSEISCPSCAGDPKACPEQSGREVKAERESRT